MITFHNDWTIFFRQPMSAALMVLAIVSLMLPAIKSGLEKLRTSRTTSGSSVQPV